MTYDDIDTTIIQTPVTGSVWLQPDTQVVTTLRTLVRKTRRANSIWLRSIGRDLLDCLCKISMCAEKMLPSPDSAG
jgi:hypothetical protein